jgi:uncharacterized protein YndB with AHSA1/START domain
MAVTTSGAATALELVVTRAFDAPRPQVFKAWSGPERLVRWWGPRGFTTAAGRPDVRPGGAWRVGMRSAAGGLRWLRCAYREIVEPERLAFTWAWEDQAGEPGRETLVTVNFAEQAGKTRLIVHQALFERAIPQRPEDDRGDWEERLDRLENLLSDVDITEERTVAAGHSPAEAATSTAETELVITRVFDAPRALVFKAWTDADRAARWWGPQGFTTESCTMDVRVGGAWRLSMRSPEGTLHTKRGVYREIVPPERLSFTYAWEDAEGNPGHEMLVTVSLTEEDGKTRLVLHHTRFESVAARDTHRGGWTSCMERFAEYLAAA